MRTGAGQLAPTQRARTAQWREASRARPSGVTPSFGRQRAAARWASRGQRARATAVMPLAQTLAALGEGSWTDLGLREVPLDAVVGTVSRPGDFDRSMRPLRGHLRRRWTSIAEATRAMVALPPVRLIQVGETYFVADGHHRVSVARAYALPTVEAQVRQVCTIAYACACLSMLDLPRKSVERNFLDRYPLPDDARPWLHLEDPSGWARIEDDARAWITGTRGEQPATYEELVSASASWWEDHVLASAHRCGGRAQATLEDHLCALRVRDAQGCCLP